MALAEPPIHSDAWYRLLFEEARDGLFFSNAEGRYLHVNHSGHRLLGYVPGELIGKHVAQLVSDRDAARLRTAMAALARGEAQLQVWPMVRKDGSVVELEVLAQQLSNHSVLAIVRDIEARNEFGRALQASEAKLRSILTTAPDVIMTVDRDGRISFINRTYPPYTPEQVVGTSCYDYVGADMRARVEQAIAHVFETGELDEYELQSPPNPEGRARWSAVRAGPQIERGRVVAVTLCATDVTEKKRAAARSTELLERLRKIASLVPGVVYQFQLRADGSTCFPYASERIREIFQVAPEDVRLDARPAFSRVHPEDHFELIESLRHSARTLRPWQHEFRVLLPNGETRWLYGNSSPEDQRDGSTLFHGIITDVTVQKHADRMRAKLEAQLRQAQKMESVGQLAGGVAHDFNNMLTAIGAFVELAQDELPPDASVRAHLTGIRDAAARGAALTQQLLAFARKKLVQPQATDLNAILTRIAPMISRLVGEHIRVQLEPAARSSVHVDVGSLEQVIMNLIVNARDAMPDGGVLTLATRDVVLDDDNEAHLQRGAYTTLTVRDTGIGMEPEVRARLFEPFFTTKAAGSGTGLGLAMCDGIVKQAGGTILVDTKIGLGSALSIYLPSQPGVTAGAPVPALSPAAQTGRETLLLVEDEPAILRLVRESLERLGYRVLAANDGVEALEIATSTQARIDLLVTDVVMPRLGGPQLARRLGELELATRVLYTSGYAESALATQGALPRGVQIIEKPYALSALAARIRELLDAPDADAARAEVALSAEDVD